MKILYRYIFTLLLVGVTLTSCEDFLEEDTRGVLGPDNWFGSDAEALVSVNGLYRLFSEPSSPNNALYGRFDNIHDFLETEVVRGLLKLMK